MEMTWIACSDRMPEDNTLCIVYGKSQYWVAPAVIVAEWWHGGDGSITEGEWCNVGYDQNDWLDAAEVTHWMPFPEPPQEWTPLPEPPPL